MITKPKTIDEYLAGVDKDQRAALQALRKTIKSAAPKAEECISYSIPAFRLNGILVGFAAKQSHCALYPFNGTVIASRDGNSAPIYLHGDHLGSISLVTNSSGVPLNMPIEVRQVMSPPST